MSIKRDLAMAGTASVATCALWFAVNWYLESSRDASAEPRSAGRTVELEILNSEVPQTQASRYSANTAPSADSATYQSGSSVNSSNAIREPVNEPAWAEKSVQERLKGTFSFIADHPEGLQDVLHWDQQLSTESRDSWSHMAESMLRSYMSDHMERNLEIVDVRCSVSRCQIRLIGKIAGDHHDAYSPAEGNLSPTHIAVEQMNNQSWWEVGGFGVATPFVMTSIDYGYVHIINITRQTDESGHDNAPRY